MLSKGLRGDPDADSVASAHQQNWRISSISASAATAHQQQQCISSTYQRISNASASAARGWAKQKSESSGHFRNLVNYLFWHNSSIVQLVLSCRNCSLNRFCMLLCFGRVHVRMSCIIWNKCTEKRKSIPALPEFFANINSLNSEIWMSMTRIRILILISDICSCFMK